MDDYSLFDTMLFDESDVLIVSKVIRATFSIKTPSATFSLKKPSATFSIKKPSATFDLLGD